MNITINNLTTGLTLEEVRSITGPLTPGVPTSDNPSVIRYQVEADPEICLHTDNDNSVVRTLYGSSVEVDSNKVLSIGDTLDEVQAILGKPHSMVGESRSFHAYPHANKNNDTLLLIFDEDILMSARFHSPDPSLTG